MNNAQNKSDRQHQVNQQHNQQEHQQQKTRQQQAPKKQGQISEVLHDNVKHEDHEYPETRLTR